MYGLPKDFDGGFLAGRTLEMVCFSENQMVLHFGGEVSITIESAFSYRDAQVVNVPVHESNVMELLGSSVSGAQGDADGTLSLIFDNGQSLKVYDTTQQYESYSIAYGDKVIIV